MPSSRGSSQSRDRTNVSCISFIAGGFFTTEPLGKPKVVAFKQTTLVTSMVYYSALLVHLVFSKFYFPTIFLSLYYMGILSSQKSMSLNF